MKNEKENLLEKMIVSVRPLWMWIRKISPKGAYLKLGDYWIKDPEMPKIDRLFQRTRNKADNTDYEDNTISAMKKYVTKGDKVTIVGGGYGVTGLAALERGGEVTLIEASKKRAENIRETWKEYNLKGSVIHGYVGSPISIWGELDGANKIEKIPECDILELDCEGAEKEVLADLDFRPRVMIVESHGHLGSPSALVKSLMEGLGYKITQELIEDAQNDVMVFIGENTSLKTD